MKFLAQFFIALVAALHFGFLYLEMFLWTKPPGLRVFRQTIQRAQDSAALAANQGLYNGFLGAGLVWSLVTPNPVLSFQLACFFLGCVMIAGIYGAYSVSRRIFILQGLPAVLGLVFVWLS